jgi:hypothetical protein
MAILGLAAAQAFAAAPTAPVQLDGFNNLDNWQIVVSNQVTASTRLVQAASGGRAKAICLDYDFNGVSGYAGIRRAIPIDYPDNYQFAFQLRGDSPSNDLQFKLVDASGDNVWWVNRPRYAFPKQWSTVSFKKRQIDKAWGPSPDKELKRSAQVEFTLYNQVGGKGTVCFDQLTLTPLPPQDTSPLTVKVSADSATSSVAADSRRPSAGTTSPASIATTSPGTSSSAGIWRSSPSRRTRALTIIIFCSAATASAALPSWRRPSTALNTVSSSRRMPVPTSLSGYRLPIPATRSTSCIGSAY